MSTSTTTWATRKQDITLITATERGERWTRDDLEFVVEFTETERDETIALALGRTLFALWAIQHRLRHEGVAGVLASYEPRREVRPLSSRVYTFVGDDVPADW